MRKIQDHYEEEYLFVADLTHNAALIGWGKFFFNSKMDLIKDKDIHMLQGEHGRHTSIGANCESYGQVIVEVFDRDLNLVKSLQTDKTYAWVTGLIPDEQYTYRIRASEGGGDSRVWGAGKLHRYDKSIRETFETDQEYACCFQTFPDPNAKEELVFAVIGDSGTGNETQMKVARALEKYVAERGVRLVIMVGDTIYKKESGGSGDDDFEWLTTYFQPYRTIMDKLPFYPCIGNHDADETEKQEDRLALYDNLLVTPRFVSQLPSLRESSVTPGLFYRFKFGADVEFICLDTSKEPSISSKRLYKYGHHDAWVQSALATPLGAPKWRIPFTHHPPYCKGPKHDEDETSLRNDIIPICIGNGIKTFFSGHEHNFQCLDRSISDPDMRCFISGGAGAYRDGRPKKSTDGYLNSWGGNDRGHFLIVTIKGSRMLVEPIDQNGSPLPLFDVKGNLIQSTSIAVEA